MRYLEKSRLEGSRKSSSGFTLIELIVVIVILAVLIGVTVGGIFGYVNKARKVMDVRTARAIVDAQAYVKVKQDNYSSAFPFKFSAHTIKGDKDYIAPAPHIGREFIYRVVYYSGDIPAPKTNKNWYWTVVYNAGEILKIYLSPTQLGETYELYPNVCKEFQVK